ncbi:hypothetical protein KAFR_0A03900 [Kazachstania africana CBS 2517]|uniref:SWI5-dependent HO expression protein 4 n=1 Tax=Kazachstania africana (strain ATCC 22294 / BCRC 22015 / CBS 2517 / CECT 1963 / NBRC 1671 / NRRL Y-8276) TaxID=1071382 RepID=H2AN75_KAZAF|nr:hypothetical protein KAFR_0A03900 [Kazachstania africana CBS 2517]CCF55825.1 hypothetical protein KAFR_0A03900 [Kazachstania africana CBS 2517]
MMSFEEITLGLQPILNSTSAQDIPMQDAYLQSYLTILEQLAISLRSHENREFARESGLMSHILITSERVLDHCFHGSDNIADRLPWFELASELIRCIANFLVDNDANREFFLGDSYSERRIQILDYYIPRILKLTDLAGKDDMLSDLQMRCIVLIKNLCLENEGRTKRLSKFIKGPLLSFLKLNQKLYSEEINTFVLGADLLAEFIETNDELIDVRDLSFFAQMIELLSKNVIAVANSEDMELNEEIEENTEEGEEEEEEDPNTELLYDFTQMLEMSVSNEKVELDFSIYPDSVTKIQNRLLNSLEILSPKAFQNKLIAMRRIVSSGGHISANRTHSNKDQRQLCQSYILSSQNGYTLAAALIILSNSIESRESADMILDTIPLTKFIEISKYFSDPMQYQGYLDIMRKLLSISNAVLLSQEQMETISLFLKVSADQTKYFQHLAPLLDSYLKKLLTVSPSSVLVRTINQTNSNLLQVVLDRGSLIACLLLDKLLVAKVATNDDSLSKIWEVVFKFQDSNTRNENDISISNLFQLSKTIGIFLRNCDIHEVKGKDNVVFRKFGTQLTLLMETIATLNGKIDKGSESVLNNGKFAAGMILSLLSKEEALTIQEEKLREISKSFFSLGPAV